MKLVEHQGFETLIPKKKKKNTKKRIKRVAVDKDMNSYAPFFLVKLINYVLHSVFSNAVVYINNHKILNINDFYAHKSTFSNQRTFPEYRGVLQCEESDYEECLDEDMDAALSQTFFTTTLKLLNRPISLIVHVKTWVVLFSTSELPNANMKLSLLLIRGNYNFYMISDNPTASVGVVDSSFHTRRIALRNDYHKKKKDMLAYTPVDENFWRP